MILNQHVINKNELFKYNKNNDDNNKKKQQAYLNIDVDITANCFDENRLQNIQMLYYNCLSIAQHRGGARRGEAGQTGHGEAG